MDSCSSSKRLDFEALTTSQCGMSTMRFMMRRGVEFIFLESPIHRILGIDIGFAVYITSRSMTRRVDGVDSHSIYRIKLREHSLLTLQCTLTILIVLCFCGLVTITINLHRFGYGQILFTFYHKEQELWIFDLPFERRHRCKRSVSIESGDYGKMMLTEAQEPVLHSVCVDSNGPIHVRLPLHELFIEELLRCRNKLWADLVCGYIRSALDGHSERIPIRLKSLIFTFFTNI